MKLHNNCGRDVSWRWNLMFIISLMIELCYSQVAGSSVNSMNLTLHWREWTISKRNHLAFLEKYLPSKKMGVLVIPEGEGEDACSLEIYFNVPTNTDDGVVFLARRACIFQKKVKMLPEKGVAGIIIYDHLYPETESLILIHEDTSDSGAVVMNSLKRKHILHLIQEGIQITTLINVGATQYLWQIYLCGFALILIVAAYVLLYCSLQQVMIRHGEWKAHTTKSELRKAVRSLELRKLKKDEFDLAEETCVVCLETYKPREIVRILTCRHIFHKQCIDRWLLKRGICPICNYAIIQGN